MTNNQQDHWSDVEKIPFGFGDHDNILRYLARQSISLVEYIRQLIDNCCDSLIDVPEENWRKRYRIVITIDRYRRKLTVSDNFHGILKDRLKQIPSQVGGTKEAGRRSLAIASHGDTSRKGKFKRIRGRDQIGIHAWLNFANLCTVSSRSSLSSGQTHTLIMAKTGEGGSEYLLGREDTNRAEEGTDVVVSDINEHSLNSIVVKRLASFLAEEYRLDLLSPDPKISIEIVEIGKDQKTKAPVYVAPVVLKGVEFKLSNGSNKKYVVPVKNRLKQTPQVIELTGNGLSNRRDGKIRVWWGHCLIYKSIAEISDFNSYPWNTGKLDLDVDASFCDPNQAKRAFVDDEGGCFVAFRKGMKEIEKQVREFVDSLEDKSKETHDKHAEKVRGIVLDSFLEDYELTGHQGRRRVKVGGDEEVNVSIKPRKTGASPASGSNGVHPNFESTKPQPPVDPNKPKKTATSKPNFNLYPAPLGEEGPRVETVTKDGKLVGVILNSDHPNYVRLVERRPASNEANRYRIDQLVNALFAHYFGQVEVSPLELVDQIDNVRYRAYVKGNLIEER